LIHKRFHKTAQKPVTQHFGCCCPQAALAPQPHLLMDAAPSVTYASARTPVAAIKTAILRTIEERSDNPRKVWAALCASARVEVNASLTTEQFTKALKYTGTGIQLTRGDTELVLGTEPLTFARFQAFVAENPSW
jgi:hypothetical protein